MGQIRAIAEDTAAERDNYLDAVGWSTNPFVGHAGVDEFVVPDHADIADATSAIQDYTGPLLFHSSYSGVGKTTLLRVLLDEFEHTHTTAQLGEHNVTPFELVSIVADAVGIGKSNSTKMTEQKIRNELQAWDDDPILLGVDEFGLNDPDTLHSLQFLNDVGVKLVLTGMTEQWEAIGRIGSDGKAFQRRVSYRLALEPLTRAQATELVQRRIMLATGRDGSDDPADVPIAPLTDGALDVAYERSKGVPGVLLPALASAVGLAAYRFDQQGETAIDATLAESVEYANGDVS